MVKLCVVVGSYGRVVRLRELVMGRCRGTSDVVSQFPDHVFTDLSSLMVNSRRIENEHLKILNWITCPYCSCYATSKF